MELHDLSKQKMHLKFIESQVIDALSIQNQSNSYYSSNQETLLCFYKNPITYENLFHFFPRIS